MIDETYQKYLMELCNNSEYYASKVIDGFIFPPGLIRYLDKYLLHNAVAQNNPILIAGDTGVGKTVFSEIAQKIYKERCKTDETKPNVVKANCAHYGKDRNLARSELFGHVKGAFTGATEDMDGLVGMADEGLLILEEISKLPEEIQTMLLRFTENGEYSKVGSPKIEHANVQIIGLTNKENILIPEFLYRFFSFYIPPLHERRQDVLYYIGAKFPALLRTLTNREALILLAYHWPGNVREVEAVAKHMLIQKALNEKKFRGKAIEKKMRYNARTLDLLENRSTLIDGNVTHRILEDLAKWKVNIKFLESLLRGYGVSLSDDRLNYPFKKFVNEIFIYFKNIPMEEYYYFKRYGVTFVKDIYIATAYMGYLVFCGLFGQNPSKNSNVLADLKNAELKFFTTENIILPKFYEAVPMDIADGFDHFPQFIKSIMSYVQRTFVPGYNYPEDIYEYWSVLEEQKKQKDSDKPQDGGYVQKPIYNFEMNKKQELKNHYENLLITTGGNVTKAANMAGLKNTTFRARCDKLGIKFRK